MANGTATTQKRAEYGSDVIVDLLKAYNIPYVAFNPGSTFRGIHDSLVNYGGNTAPGIITCCHEEIAVFVAAGYAKATGRPMAAIVHDLSGLLHATMAIYNAWYDRVPLIVLGGTAPMDFSRRRPRADWDHSALIPGNLVRDFVKWDDQPHTIANFPESFMRAYKVAMTPPRGPVYICYDAELQEQRLSQPLDLPDVSRYAPPSPIRPDHDSLRRAAQWLVAAENPVIMADYVYRDAKVAASLVELIELLAIPVVDRARFNIGLAPQHPLNLTGAEKEVLEPADVVLALDTADLFADVSSKQGIGVTPYRYLNDVISPNARVIQISLAQLLMRAWSQEYGRLQPVDLDILGSTSLALPELIALCRELIGQDAGKLEKYRLRFERLRGIHDELHSRWREEADKKRDELPISVARLCDDVWEVIKGEDWLLANDAVKSWNQKLWKWDRADQWLGWTGGGLGYGMGTSLGVTLAHKGSNKLCINLQADGEFLYTTSALWTAAHHQIPLLTIMFNNRAYFNSEQHAQTMARERGRPESNKGIGNRIVQPPVDFARVAQGFGVYSEGPVEKPEDVRAAVTRAMKVVKEKRVPALVDVVTQPR